MPNSLDPELERPWTLLALIGRPSSSAVVCGDLDPILEDPLHVQVLLLKLLPFWRRPILIC